MGAVGFSFGSMSLMVSGSVSFGKVGIKSSFFILTFSFPVPLPPTFANYFYYHHVKSKVTPTNNWTVY